MKNTLKGSMKKVMGTKIGKIAVVGTLAFTIFGGGLASASYVMNVFNYTNASLVQTKISNLGLALDTENRKKYQLFDDKNALTAQVTKLNAEILVLKEGNPEDLATINTLKAEIVTLNGRIATLNAQITALNTSNATKESDINTLNTQITNANTKINEQLNELEGIESDYNGGKRPTDMPVPPQ